jgi:hypothetical protein
MKSRIMLGAALCVAMVGAGVAVAQRPERDIDLPAGLDEARRGTKGKQG